MTLTIISAKFCNPDHDGVIAQTKERGAVVMKPRDVPNNISIEPYQKTEQEIKDEVKSVLAGTDSQMARVAEDIMGLLISRNILSEEDLPETVRDKLAERKALREALK